MNIKAESTMLADYAFVSKEGKLSIMGVFDEIKVESFPEDIHTAYFITCLKGEPNKSINLDFITRTKKEIIKKERLDVFFANNGKIDFLFELVNLEFDEPDTYYFEIEYENKIITSVELLISQQTKQTKVLN